MDNRSPFAPERFPDLPAIPGVRLSTAATGMRYRGRPDLLLAALPPGTRAAGALTQSATRAAPVDWCRSVLERGQARGLLVNAGIANAFTGHDGDDAARRMAGLGAAALGCPEEEILIASTGVIGTRLPTDSIAAAMRDLTVGLRPEGWEDAARAIMTTDTFPKGAGAITDIDGTPIRLTGIAKGSGMIAPNMATMLGFLFTDATLPAALLKSLILEAVEASFNSITVDSDTSTSDTVLLLATAQTRHLPIQDSRDPALDRFRASLRALCIDLAQQIVKDGEGARKFITITVTGAANDGAARRIALAIANSPLVKTAIAGADANWGRVVMAVGKAGEHVERDRLAIAFGGIVIARDGSGLPNYDEAPVAAHLQGSHIDIDVDVGAGGTGTARVWTCDLTDRYIAINADYRS